MKAPVLNEQQFAQVFRYTETMERPAMYRLVMLLTVKLGLRPMELAGMERSWFRGNELRIPLGHSKRGQGRSLPVDQELLCALNDHMADRRGRVFLNAAGQAFTASGISEAIRRLYRLAGVQGSAYSGRRTMATRMVDRGVNIAIASEVLGHSNIATTASYVGITDIMMRRALFA